VGKVEFKVVELVSLVLVVGAIVLLGLRAISFEQALTLVSLAVSLLGGKYIARYEDRLLKKLREAFFKRKV
jgi:hypothetical protein